jgi:hypothetical protein
MQDSMSNVWVSGKVREPIRLLLKKSEEVCK